MSLASLGFRGLVVSSVENFIEFVKQPEKQVGFSTLAPSALGKTSTTTTGGTYLYMAPELLNSEKFGGNVPGQHSPRTYTPSVW